MIVPMASKKPDSTSVNSTTVAVSAPAVTKPPNRSKWPTSPKSGAATSDSGTRGATTPQSAGSTAVSEFTRMARSAVTAMLMRMAAGIPRTYRRIISSRPKQNTATGQPVRCPVAPSCTGVPEPRATKPASTRPISAMNSPIPTLIACLSASGIAFMISVRRPVTASRMITAPSSTTRPMACAHVMCGAAW